MHELGLAQDTLDCALQAAARQGAGRITGLRLRIGDLSGVVPEALYFALETILAGTPADGATIDIERVAAVCFCPDCKAEFPVEAFVYTCPNCGRAGCDLVRGREMTLVSLEVD
jgi:hydrogenase nickel incorporation protein HypA/HybF